MKNPESRLGEILVEEKIITASQLEEGLAKRAELGGFLGQALIELGHIDQDTLTLILVKQCRIPHLNLEDYSISPDVHGVIPLELCRKHHVLPVDKMGKILTVAMVDPLNTNALEAVRAAFPELRIKPILCDWPDFQQAFEKFKVVKPKDETVPDAPVVQPDPESPAPATANKPAPIPAQAPRTAPPPQPTAAPAMSADAIKSAVREGMRENMADLQRSVSDASELLRHAHATEHAAVADAQRRDLAQASAAPSAANPVTSIEEFVDGRRADLTFDTFIVGSSNAPLVDLASAVAQAPGRDQNPFFVCGDVGLGKTHLITAIGHALKASNPAMRVGLTSASRFADDAVAARRTHAQEALRRVYEQCDALIFDDVQFLGGRIEAQEDLFHIFNFMQERGKQIVLAGDRAPDKLGLLEKRLVSRFDSGIVATIHAPDWETRVRILRHYATQLNVEAPDDAIAMIAMRHPDDVRRLIGSLRKVAAWARSNGGTITAEIASRVLAEGVAEAAA